MKTYMETVEKATAFLRTQTVRSPQIGILTGTGLGDVISALKVEAGLDYTEIPHFPLATVQSHLGRLFFGTIGAKTAMVLQGRFHLYEGYASLQVTFPIRVMQRLGVHTLIVTNAAGGLNPGFSPGEIMVIRDHINLTGESPLIGPNCDEWGPRFPDMSVVYDKNLHDLAKEAARRSGISAQSGVYVGLKGPSLETPAEVRFLRTIGADAVGFSTVQEAITAVHGGMRVLGLSIITNVHDPDDPTPSSVEEIIETARAATGKVDEIIRAVSADC